MGATSGHLDHTWRAIQNSHLYWRCEKLSIAPPEAEFIILDALLRRDYLCDYVIWKMWLQKPTGAVFAHSAYTGHRRPS